MILSLQNFSWEIGLYTISYNGILIHENIWQKLIFKLGNFIFMHEIFMPRYFHAWNFLYWNGRFITVVQVWTAEFFSAVHTLHHRTSCLWGSRLTCWAPYLSYCRYQSGYPPCRCVSGLKQWNLLRPRVSLESAVRTPSFSIQCPISASSAPPSFRQSPWPVANLRTASLLRTYPPPPL